jgi:two-component system nitrate/nitrite response regulator NarL
MTVPLSGQSIRVLIADDHPHGREGMRDILSVDADFQVAGEAVNGEEAIEMADLLLPDLILMDINMPGIGGLEATLRIKTKHPQIKIVMVTVSDDITDLFEAIKRGAQGYLLKNLSPSAWHEYLRAVAVEEAPMTKELAYQLLREFSGGPERDQAVAPEQKGAAGARAGSGFGSRGAGNSARERDDSVTPLSSREREILESVASGHSNRAIAEAFGLSEHTVKNHMKNILQKLHLANRVQLTRYAMEQGLVEPYNQ